MVQEMVGAEVIYYIMQRVYRMQIAVCDDERLFRDVIKDAVYAYSNMYRLEISIDDYDCGEDLLNSAQKYDIVFLDYKMAGMYNKRIGVALCRNEVYHGKVDYLHRYCFGYCADAICMQQQQQRR